MHTISINPKEFFSRIKLHKSADKLASRTDDASIRAFQSQQPDLINTENVYKTEIKNNAGEVRFYTTTTPGKFRLYNTNGIMLYQKVNTPYGSIIDTVYSKDGVKLYTLDRQPNGNAIKKTFNKDGSIRKRIEFSSDEVVSKTAFVTPEIAQQDAKKLPEYLYHITHADNLAGILKNGLNMSFDKRLIEDGEKACFFVSESDLLHNWANLTNKQNSSIEKSLLVKLLHHCAFHSDENAGLVLLKVPTRNLNLDKIKVRNQEDILNPFPQYRLLSEQDSDDYTLLEDYLIDNKIAPNDNLGAENIVMNIFLSDYLQRIQEGIGLDKLDEYNDKPLEYFYTDSIKPSDIEIVGKIPSDKITKMSSFDKESELYAKELVSSLLD
ncbi:MAG: hypothetical protein IJ003_03680 [Candidatus Gastranaerophilales bacterium]|nr:hypothetical protein [Candidatus Gastranaerophilales bacterium]